MSDNGNGNLPTVTVEKFDAGVQVNRGRLRKLLGPRADQIHPRAFKYWPQGHLILVAMDTMPDQLDSGLHVPDTVVDHEQLSIGAGVVIAAGPLVGVPPIPHPGGLAITANQLVGEHILFGSNAGSYVRLSFAGVSKEYPVHVCVLSDRDIWFLDGSPPEEWGKIE